MRLAQASTSLPAGICQPRTNPGTIHQTCKHKNALAGVFDFRGLNPNEMNGLWRTGTI